MKKQNTIVEGSIEMAEENGFSVYYQSSKRNDNNPIRVTVLSKLSDKTFRVRTHGNTPVNFSARITSLFIIP